MHLQSLLTALFLPGSLINFTSSNRVFENFEKKFFFKSTNEKKMSSITSQ